MIYSTLSCTARHSDLLLTVHQGRMYRDSKPLQRHYFRRRTSNLSNWPGNQSSRTCLSRKGSRSCLSRKGSKCTYCKLYWIMNTATKTGGMAPPFLNLSPRWRRLVILTPRPFYPLGKNPLRLEWRMNGNERLDSVTKRKNLVSASNWNPHCPSRSPVTVSTTSAHQ